MKESAYGECRVCRVRETMIKTLDSMNSKLICLLNEARANSNIQLMASERRANELLTNEIERLQARLEKVKPTKE